MTRVRMKRRHPFGLRSRLGLRDLLAEAQAGVLQRPARSALTTLGTMLGVGAFVAVLGLTSTASGQIDKHFNALVETTVTVSDVGDGQRHTADNPVSVDFPKDAEGRITALNGAVAAGVYWTTPLRNPVIAASLAVTAQSTSNAGDLTVYAASPGLFRAVRAVVGSGLVFNSFHEARAEHVAVLGAAAAGRLGITNLNGLPAVFINGTAFSVVGIISDTQRLPEMLSGIILPSTTALDLYGPPDPSVSPAQMVIETRTGAAPLIARQAPIALRPDNSHLMVAMPPPDPRALRQSVSGDLSSLFLALAAICLVIGAIAITNTTLIAVMERVGEIGLRRSLGARRRHIAAQFLAESVTLGTLGGLVGTAAGIAVVLAVAIERHWTAVIDPATALPAPLLGTSVGMLAGLYPAWRSATIEPLDALRQ